MDKFTVNQLAKLAGVSVRTLHHYDHIGLLKPGIRSESNYRFYGQKELLRLQQILFYRELDIPLGQIAEILDEPGFDMLKALQQHKQELQKRKNRMDELLQTIDSTIIQLKQNETMNYEEMYKGFSKEQAEAYEKEAREKWGDIFEESKQRALKMTRQEWQALQQEGEDINKALAELIHLEVADERVQTLVKRHFAMIGQYYTVTPEIYKGLAEMYVADERFTATYEKYKHGLADFLSRAMLYYCKN